MAKLGVGIGEEFPMDDSVGAEDEEALRRAREWARRKQAFRDFWDKVGIAAEESFGEDWDHYAGRLRTIRWWPYGVLLLVCAALFVISLVSALVAAALAAAPVLFTTALLFAVVFWLYRKRHGRPDVIVTPPPMQS